VSRISAVLDAQNAWFGAVRTEQIDRRHEGEQSFWDEAIRSVIDGGGEMPDRTDRLAPTLTTIDPWHDGQVEIGMTTR